MNTPLQNVKQAKNRGDISLAFDVGHSSIGWAVLHKNARVGNPEIVGCGAVIFPADDCLASQRRAFRRQRRHIRSTRQRIARLKILFEYLGVLTRAQLDAPGCAWPWKLAARVLQGGQLLVWPELWDVLRWYAHNRGYDGNRRWAANDVEALKEDTEKEENAMRLMQKHGLTTMTETFCKELGVEPGGKKRSSMTRFKGLNAAFPRETVEAEVRKILDAHFDKLPDVNDDLVRVLIGADPRDKLAWQAILCPSLKLPKRYQGGLLFGQLVPRFDNRIISKCPITGTKVPTRHSQEFLEFRWAMQLANIRVANVGEIELRPLRPEERKSLDEQMRELGSMTEKELTKAVREITRCERDNLETMLMHPDAKEALLLNPVRRLARSEKLKKIWPLLPDKVQRRATNVWRRGRPITLAGLREHLIASGDAPDSFDAEIQRLLDAQKTKKRGKATAPLTRDQILAEPLLVRRLDGRAAYSRPILRQAVAEVMAGRHPKEEGGCLFRTEQMLAAERERKIDEQTNNHLVRHRLLILERLERDIIKTYAENDAKRIAGVTIEVNRDLRAMSGKTAKEKAQELGQRLANFKSVAKKLEEAFEGQNVEISPGLIRKARIAEDLGWVCPYTGQKYDAYQLLHRTVDKDHIIPRSQRASDSLDSLVITFSTINKCKGKRTALKFIQDQQGQPVPGLPQLSIVTLAQYKAFVENLETFKGHDDDKRRKKNRQRLLLLQDYDEPEFTPRDLTQTSQLARLGQQVLLKNLPHLGPEHVVSMPGSVTGLVRKGWDLLGCLSLANPNVLNADNKPKTKTEVRDITHLHHALDACVLGLANYFIPANGAIWNLIVKRRLNEDEQTQLLQATKGIFNFSAERRFGLKELPNDLKEQLRQRLAERRVVQHVPSEISGLHVEQNTWRVLSTAEGEATIRQRSRKPEGSRVEKRATEKVSKLLGLQPEDNAGKLRAVKGVLIIPENYGVALDPEPTVIPFHKVWSRLQEGKKANGGKTPRVLRNGQLIRFKEKGREQIWRVRSIKNTARGIMLDISRPDEVAVARGGNRLRSFLKSGIEILPVILCGHNAT